MRYKTCVPIAEKTPSMLVRAMKRALKKSEYAELRLDFLAPADVPAALETAGRDLGRCVCTLRPRTEGGVFSGTEAERVSILKMVAEYGPSLMDIEYGTVSKNVGLAKYVKATKTPVLVSWHDFGGTPKTPDLVKRVQRMRRFSDRIKLVTTAVAADDPARVLSLYGRLPPKTSLIAFAMGDAGRISRVLCLYLGSPYTYASLGRAVAPGQFSVGEIGRITGLRGR